MKKKTVIGKVGKTKSGLKKVFEIKDGKVTIGKEVGPYEKYYPLFKWLQKNAPEYISVIVIEGHEVISIKPLPPQVILQMPPDILELYKELIGEIYDPDIRIVHRNDCTLFVFLNGQIHYSGKKRAS